MSHILLRDEPRQGVRSPLTALRVERVATGLAAAAVLLVCIPAVLFMIFGYANSLTHWVFWSGFACTSIAAPIGLLLRRRRLVGRVRLEDFRTGSTVSRGVSPRGHVRHRTGISSKTFLQVVSAVILAVTGVVLVVATL